MSKMTLKTRVVNALKQQRLQLKKCAWATDADGKPMYHVERIPNPFVVSMGMQSLNGPYSIEELYKRYVDSSFNQNATA